MFTNASTIFRTTNSTWYFDMKGDGRAKVLRLPNRPGAANHDNLNGVVIEARQVAMYQHRDGSVCLSMIVETAGDTLLDVPVMTGAILNYL